MSACGRRQRGSLDSGGLGEDEEALGGEGKGSSSTLNWRQLMMPSTVLCKEGSKGAVQVGEGRGGGQDIVAIVPADARNQKI